MTRWVLSESIIEHEAGSPEVFRRGEAYWRRGHVENACQREDGSIITADVEGSESIPYSVIIRFTPTGRISTAECDCPYSDEWDGWCKHIVAVLLLALRSPEKLKTVAPLSETLSRLDGADLEVLLLRLAAHDPRLGDDIVTLAKSIKGSHR